MDDASFHNGEEQVDAQQDGLLRHGNLDPDDLRQADGYFHRPSSSRTEGAFQRRRLPSASSSSRPSRPSNQVPRVPNVMVHDPSQKTGSDIEDKVIGLGQDVFNTAPTRNPPRQTSAPTSAGSTQPSFPRPAVAGGSSRQPERPSLSSSSATHFNTDDIYSTSPVDSSPVSPIGQQGGVYEGGHGRTSSSTGHHHQPDAVASSLLSSPPTRRPPPPQSYSQRPVVPYDAPPAYTPPSPTSQHPHTPSNSSDSYNTFPTTNGAAMGRPEGQSPYNQADGHVETAPLLPRSNSIEPPSSFTIGGKRKNWFLEFLILVLVVTGILTIPLGLWMKRNHSNSPLVPNEPVRDHLPAPGSPSAPDSPPENGDGPKDSDGIPVNFPYGKCTVDKGYGFTSGMGVQLLPSKGISISERVEQTKKVSKGMQLGVYGYLAVRPYPSGSNYDGDNKGRISLAIFSNIALAEDVVVSYDSSSQHFEVTMPPVVEWEENIMPCAVVNITLWVPSTSSVLRELSISTVHLDLLLADDLDLKIQGMSLRTVVGDVEGAASKEKVEGGGGRTTDTGTAVSVRPMPDSYKLVSNIVSAISTSGDIKGSWYLAERLDLETTSGDVSAYIVPLDMPDKIAELHVKTVNGDIMIEEKGAKDGTVPTRNYKTTMQTTSGDIDARAAFGCIGSFEAVSGNVQLAALPVVLRDNSGLWMMLCTGSQSGDTKLDLLDPVFYGGGKESSRRLAAAAVVGDMTGAEASLRDRPYQTPDPEKLIVFNGDDEEEEEEEERTNDSERSVTIKGGGSDFPEEGFRALTSQHKSISGDIKLMYPESWEGHLKLQTHSGSLAADGERMKIDKAVKFPWTKSLEGRNGVDAPDEGSSVEATCVSGDIKLCVGKAC
ncbi:hypothetical protein MKZ38_002791 [Zalerion maritima]|uniref:DUF4097 domain-containing protein n=1 Tax=Zalerion maritima TaxID=339359 RepID=A0AAD5RNI4_9PEZI|nr:hypothetical protein MKZ38_002791 [Zalerion maritima]